MTRRGPRVLLTGAGGFIGSHLLESLVREGYSVRALLHYSGRQDRANLVHVPHEVLDDVELVWGDVTDSGQIPRLVAGCETVLHLAALIGIPYSYIAPASYMAVNAIGTLNVLEACRVEGVTRVIVTSTSEVYGTAQTESITEEHPLAAQSPYAASKIAADKLAESYWRSFDLPVVVLRPFNAFGPRQSLRAVVPTIISQAMAEGETIELGSQWPQRDWTYVGDLVRAFVLALQTPGIEGQTIHVGTGRAISVGELATLILTMMGEESGRISRSTAAARVRPAGSEVGRLRCDASKALRLLDWAPTTSLEAGLQQTIEFYRGVPELVGVGQYVV